MSHLYHFLYKIVNKLTGRYYYGMHSTSNLNDGYFGSGKLVLRSIAKHGKHNHSFEIIEYCPDRQTLKRREAELVTAELIKDNNCLNMKPGGEGGFCNEEHLRKFLEAQSKTWNGRKHTDETKALMSTVDRSGKRNSSFGRVWISRDGVNRKIKPNLLWLYLKIGYQKGRPSVAKKLKQYNAELNDCS